MLLQVLAVLAALAYLAMQAWGLFASLRHGRALAGAGRNAAGRAGALIVAQQFLASAAAPASATPAAISAAARAAWLRLFGERVRRADAADLVVGHAAPRLPRQAHLPRIARGLPVLLLHGYGCNSGYWTQLTPLLDAAGISHATLDLEPITADIDDYVPLVRARGCSSCAPRTRRAASW